jgi:hypothetical protein
VTLVERKRLGFKTPNEVFMQSLNRVALCVWIYDVFLLI